MNHDGTAYGMWGLVLIESAFFIIFAFSFTRPKTRTDWRSFGAFSAFIVALFAEMYGFPLTIFLLSGWLASHYPGVDFMSHESGHMLHTLLGLKGNPHMDPLHIVSEVLIVAGLFLLASSWRVLYAAQKSQTLATTGPYAYIRHPQYIAFIAVMFGFLLQWPTIPTLVMFPVLVWMYVRLAKAEERQVQTEFREAYTNYARGVPAFIPHLRSRQLTE
ncbi:MAG TPA: isoprenylcysteine carboxylmethyltransferase family protein [Terriglobales bacterium]